MFIVVTKTKTKLYKPAQLKLLFVLFSPTFRSAIMAVLIDGSFCSAMNNEEQPSLVVFVVHLTSDDC